MSDISNSDDIIDSRDVIARIEELESEREDAPIHTTCIHCGLDIEGSEASADWRDRGNNSHCPNPQNEGAGLTVEHEAPADTRGELPEEEAEELKALQELAEEAEGYCPDWHHGAPLIRDSYFTEYAKELAEDCGMIPSKRSWPMNCINWEAAAEELRGDYTSVDFDGVEYWVR